MDNIVKRGGDGDARLGGRALRDAGQQSPGDFHILFTHFSRHLICDWC